MKRGVFAVMIGIAACSGEAGKNPPVAAADSVSARLELVTTIDPGEADPFLNVSSLALDGEGNVYVLDQGARNIRVFDSTGAPVRTIGREGAGPAEFAMPYALAWTGDTLAVLDPGNGRLELVTRDGRHAATWRGSRITGRQVRLWQAGPSRFFLDGYRPTPDGKLQMLYVSAGPEGGRDTLVIPERTGADAATAVTCKLKNGTITWFEVPFASQRMHAVSPEGHLVVARTGDYRFIWVDTAGKIRRMMAYGADTLRIPDAYWDSVRAEFDDWRAKMTGAECDGSDLPRPPRKDVLRAAEFDDRGRLWVEAATERGFRLDAWNASVDSLKGSFPAPERDADVPFVVRGDRLALVVEGEEGQAVSVYRIDLGS
jgi:hypothetical protein